jgi:hypothetical protein
MLGRWLALGSPQYPSFDPGQQITYISDIGARSWGKPLFIAGSATAVVVFDLAFLSERWLRHRGRLAPNYNNTEKILSVFATLFAVAGAAGLILLTIFDTVHYPHTHVAMLILFIAGYIISAIFICAEYQRLGIHYREHRILSISFWIKLGFIFVELSLAIAFGVLGNRGMRNPAAVLEWVISLIFILYMWSFIIDFLPATQTKNKSDRFLPPVRKSDDEMAMNTETQGNMVGGPVYTGGGQNGHTTTYAQAGPGTERYNSSPLNQQPSRNF